MKSRRVFLKNSVAIAAGSLVLPTANALPLLYDAGSDKVNKLNDVAAGQVMTIAGLITAESIGLTLSHEHIMVDFIGASQVSKGRYKVSEVVEKATKHLLEIKSLGWKTFVDCTPAYLGRDVAVLKQLSAKTGLNIITNTGYYGAANEKHIPQHAYHENAPVIAKRWISEYKNGIDDSGIKPGFIKCGVDKFPLSVVQGKLIEAAAITHFETGLTIGVHTGDGKAALEQLKILKEHNVSPAAWIWIHAQNEPDRILHINAARAGGFVSFDGYSEKETTSWLTFLTDMKKEDLLSQVLLSQDAGWYHVGEPTGGQFRPFTDISRVLLPAMQRSGFTDSEIKLLFITNPGKAFAIKKRLLTPN